MKNTLVWKNNFTFENQLDNHTFYLDTDSEMGGNNLGPRPKGLLLTALCGCTGFDVVSILKKMKYENYEFYLEADADAGEEHPRVYTRIYLNYHFKGDVPADKALKAVKLSEERYCAVSAMLSKVCPIEAHVYLNEEKIL